MRGNSEFRRDLHVTGSLSDRSIRGAPGATCSLFLNPNLPLTPAVQAGSKEIKRTETSSASGFGLFNRALVEGGGARRLFTAVSVRHSSSETTVDIVIFCSVLFLKPASSVPLLHPLVYDMPPWVQHSKVSRVCTAVLMLYNLYSTPRFYLFQSDMCNMFSRSHTEGWGRPNFCVARLVHPASIDQSPCDHTSVILAYTWEELCAIFPPYMYIYILNTITDMVSPSPPSHRGFSRPICGLFHSWSHLVAAVWTLFCPTIVVRGNGGPKARAHVKTQASISPCFYFIFRPWNTPKEKSTNLRLLSTYRSSGSMWRIRVAHVKWNVCVVCWYPINSGRQSTHPVVEYLRAPAGATL